MEEVMGPDIVIKVVVIIGVLAFLLVVANMLIEAI